MAVNNPSVDNGGYASLLENIEKSGFVVRGSKITRGNAKWEDFWKVVGSDDTTISDVKEELNKVTLKVELDLVFVGADSVRTLREMFGGYPEPEIDDPYGSEREGE